jgi:hypothetical protein
MLFDLCVAFAWMYVENVYRKCDMPKIELIYMRTVYSMRLNASSDFCHINFNMTYLHEYSIMEYHHQFITYD